ncbi:Splicing factor [Globisporangium polare]
MAGYGDEYGATDELADANTLSELQLGVRGYACHVFDDARVAWSLHREQHLIPWRMESDLCVDRFDARNLLDDRALFRRLKKPVQRGNASYSNKFTSDAMTDLERELHALRYADYEVEFPPPVVEETPVENKFPYAYPEDHDEEEEEECAGGEAFQPSWVGTEHLTQPKSKKLREIIAATAKKARDHPQLEVMLKVKLSANTKFGFLEPSHGFHAYYAYLRDEDPPLRPAPVGKASGASLLLGAEYSDASDDEAHEDPMPPQIEDKTMEAAGEEKPVDDDAEKKAMRLKRAKLLAGHFQHAALEKKAPSSTPPAASAEQETSPEHVNNRKRSVDRMRSSRSRSPRRRSRSRSPPIRRRSKFRSRSRS